MGKSRVRTSVEGASSALFHDLRLSTCAWVVAPSIVVIREKTMSTLLAPNLFKIHSFSRTIRPSGQEPHPHALPWLCTPNSHLSDHTRLLPR